LNGGYTWPGGTSDIDLYALTGNQNKITKTKQTTNIRTIHNKRTNKQT